MWGFQDRLGGQYSPAYTSVFNTWFLGRPEIVVFGGLGGPEKSAISGRPKNHVWKQKPKRMISPAGSEALRFEGHLLTKICPPCTRVCCGHESGGAAFRENKTNIVSMIKGIPKWFVGQMIFWRPGVPRPKDHTFSRKPCFFSLAAGGRANKPVVSRRCVVFG
jgi:hypothetical protein